MKSFGGFIYIYENKVNCNKIIFDKELLMIFKFLEVYMIDFFFFD